MTGLGAWAGAAPVVFVTVAWVLLPGLIVTYAAGLRGVLAWGTAPLVSVGSIALAAVLGGVVGVPWSAPVAVVPALVAAVLAAGVGLLRRNAEPRSAPAPRDGRAVAFAAGVGGAVALGLGALTLAAGTGSPSAVSQTFDAVFHYNAVARIVATGDASSLVTGTLNIPVAATAFYPAAWHDLVSLVVLSTGASVPVAANVVAGVVAVIVWPLACLVLVRHVAGPSWPAALLTPVVAIGFVAFPWSLLSFGVLWPNLLGLSLVPVGLAAVVGVCRTGIHTPGPGRSGLTLALAVGTLALAHPNALISLAALAVLPLAWRFGRWARARHRRGERVLPVAAVVAVAAAGAGILVVLLVSPVFDDVRSFDWPAYQSPAQAVGEVALSATNGRDAAWAISAVVLIGAVAAWRAPDRRWLVPAHLVSTGLFVLASAFESTLSAALTGFWYNDSYRLAAMLPITGVPLAVLGLTAIGAAIHGAWARRSPGPAVTSVAAAAVLVLVTSGMYVRDHAQVVDDAYPRADQPHGLVTTEEQAFFGRVGELVEPGAVVAQNPWSGSALLWALGGRQTLFPHLTGQWTPDQLLLAARFRDAATDPAVCGAAQRLDVRYLLIGVPDFWSGDPRAARYPGLVAPTSGFRRVAADGAGNALYELTACGGEPRTTDG